MTPSISSRRPPIQRTLQRLCIGSLLWGFLVSSTVRAFSPTSPTTFLFRPPSHYHYHHHHHHHHHPSARARISIPQGSSSLALAKTDGGDDTVCTIQILMSDTGGGHRASANALRDAFDVLYPGQIQCDIVDIFTDYGPFWPYDDVVAGYKLMAEYPITWEIFYRFGESEFGMCLNNVMQEAFCFDSFKECMNRPSGTTKKRADMVVSVHPLCQDLPLRILADLDSGGQSREPSARKTPFCTVVTDLGSAHPTWFNPDVDKCFVPSDVLNQAAKKRKLQSEQIVQHGLPIRKGFWSTGSSATMISKVSKEAMRKELGLDIDLPVVLIVGGGDGMGGIESISKELGNQLGRSGTKPTAQMVVVCGNNDAAKKKLEASNWGKGVKTYIKGFVNNMDEFMRASDALVTKAGPGTIAEASICGLPCMLFSFL